MEQINSEKYELGDKIKFNCSICEETTTHEMVSADMGGITPLCENWESHPPLFGE